MSNYSSMHGEIKLSKTDFFKVHNRLRRFLKSNQENLYKKTIEAYERIGKKTIVADLKKRSLAPVCLMNIDSDIAFFIKEAGGRKPLKKDIVETYTAKTKVFENSSGAIIFDSSDFTITVDVDENNHAIESFKRSFYFRGLMSGFSELKWSRKEHGGVIFGEDEYSDGKFIECKFGKAGDEINNRMLKARHIMFGGR